MGTTDNRTLLQKADLALADLTATTGLLQPAQASKFMKLLIKESKVLPKLTVVPMKSHKQKIDKIGFTGRVLRAGNEAQALAVGDRVKPTMTQVELDAQLFKAEIRLDNEILEDSIERGQLRNTIMQMLAEYIGRDMEEVVITGDTASTDPFLAKFDGILKQAASNAVDHGDSTTNRSVFKNLMKALPQEFLRSKDRMEFWTSIDSEIDYADSLADRATVLGDTHTQEKPAVKYSGVPIYSIPLFPENVGTGTHCTNILFLDPKNVQLGIWRQIRLETDKDVSAGVLVVVASLRFDTRYAHELAVAKASNVKVI